MDRSQPLLRRGQMPRGMTLIESVMSLAILSVILLIASQLSMSMSEVTAEETAETQVQTDLRRAMSELVFLLEESRPVALWREDQIAANLPHLPKAPDGTYNYNGNEDTRDRGMCFTFTLPIKEVSGKLRRKGTARINSEDAGQAFYGAGDGGADLPDEYVAGDDVKKHNTYTVFFLPNGEVLDEAVEGKDLDANGVATDKFIYGGLFISQDNTQQIRQITGRIAIKKFVGLKALYPTAFDEFKYRSRDRRGVCFCLEYEEYQLDDNDNGIYDSSAGDKWESDDNKNDLWDVKMIIKFYFPNIQNDPRRGRIFRMRAVETRVNYFRNTYKYPRIIKGK